ncbi:MAG: lipopolysaccharide biosynthesis protein [Haloferacaceae archaeon]
MVRRRDGDEIALLDSSIRTVGGATVSTSLYVLSGLVYVAVTSPAATGTYFFVAITTALVLRPVRGISQTLQKIGSERGQDVGTYLGVALGFTAVYLLLGGAVVAVGADELTRRTVFTAELLGPGSLYAVALALSMVVTSLVGAIGYPSAQTWLSGAQSAARLALVVLFASAIDSTAELLLVGTGVRLALFVPVGLSLGVVPRRPGRDAVGRAWAFAKWSIPDQILDRFSYNMPVFVLGVVGTPAAVGVYEAADRFADFGATIAWRLSSPLLTKVSGDAATGHDYSAYLDGAVTGGTGVTFLVCGYLLAAHDVVARVAFADAQAAFSATVLIVGGVNVFRGFWTLTSHAIEGLGKPSVSARTKLYGLAVSVPIPAVFGAEFGAVAGAVGYGVMNLVVFAYVCYYARDVLGEVPVDVPMAMRLAVGAGVAYGLTTGVIAGVRTSGLSELAVAVVAAAVSLVGFTGVVLVVSTPARVVARRVLELCAGRVGSVV